MLFNVSIEEALKHTQKLREMVKKGDLLAFGDEMVILATYIA